MASRTSTTAVMMAAIAAMLAIASAAGENSKCAASVSHCAALHCTAGLAGQAWLCFLCLMHEHTYVTEKSQHCAARCKHNTTDACRFCRCRCVMSALPSPAELQQAHSSSSRAANRRLLQLPGGQNLMQGLAGAMGSQVGGEGQGDALNSDVTCSVIAAWHS